MTPFSGRSVGIRFEFTEELPSSECPPGHAGGALRMWLGGTPVWCGADGQPVLWTWLSFLDGLGRTWRWLTCETAYPIPITPEHIGLLDEVLANRWDGMDDEQRDGEMDLMFDFNHRHNLAHLVRGISLPRVMALRSGDEVELWSPCLSRPIRIAFVEFEEELTKLGDILSQLTMQSSAEAPAAARLSWQKRGGCIII